MTGVTPQLDELAERLRRLEDITAIQQLFVDYGLHLDSHDFAAYAALFAPEGEVLLGPLGRAKGRDEIRELMERTLGPVPAGRSFHLISNPVVTLEGDHARARVMWTVIQQDAQGRPVVGMIGHHLDDLVRLDGKWHFLRRAGHIDIPSAYPSE